MSHLESTSSFERVTKVGAVVLRMAQDGFEFLIIQPKPKAATPDDLPPMGLVRGTRAMILPDGQVVDAHHDGLTAPPANAVLEPLTETLAREIEEEAGVTREMLSTARVQDLGAHLFASKKKTPYPIQWYAVMLDESAVALSHTGMQDSLYSEWVSFTKLQEYVEKGKASSGYVPVVEMALTALTSA